MRALGLGLDTDHSAQPAERSLGHRDVWAIGVITYFLLCGYTPFDRDTNYEEMQAILAADYHFAPEEYWRGVSDTARDFIRRCLTVDQGRRITAHQALSHPWISPPSDAAGTHGPGEDLLPVVRKNFNARRTLHAAIDTIRAINKLREGGAAGMMNGAASRDPQRHQPRAPAPGTGAAPPLAGGRDGAGDRMEVEGEPGRQLVGPANDEMEVDGRGYGRGQTPAMIWAQEKKIQETTQLWSKGGNGAR